MGVFFLSGKCFVTTINNLWSILICIYGFFGKKPQTYKRLKRTEVIKCPKVNCLDVFCVLQSVKVGL